MCITAVIVCVMLCVAFIIHDREKSNENPQLQEKGTLSNMMSAFVTNFSHNKINYNTEMTMM